MIQNFRIINDFLKEMKTFSFDKQLILVHSNENYIMFTFSLHHVACIIKYINHFLLCID